jgi:hypothetical protein
MLNDIPGMTAVRHRALGKVARRFLPILLVHARTARNGGDPCCNHGLIGEPSLRDAQAVSHICKPARATMVSEPRGNAITSFIMIQLTSDIGNAAA